MRTTWITYPKVWDNLGKPKLIPDKTTLSADKGVKCFSPFDGSMLHQVVGEVKAHQAEDG